MSDWLSISRNQAEERFHALAAPTNKDENFRFSRVELPLGLGSEDLPETGKLPSELDVLDEGEGSLLSLHGEEAKLTGAVPGVIFSDLLRAATIGSELVRARIREEGIFAKDKFAQLSASRWRNGAFLHVPAGMKLEHPVRSAFYPSAPEEHTRNLVVLEEGAEAVLIQEVFSAEEHKFVGELTDVKLGAGAKLHWVILQRYSQATTAVIRQSVELGVGSQLRMTPLHLGGASVQVRLETRLSEGAELSLLGAARGDGQQHFDFWLDADHQGSRSKSQTDFYFVMGGASRAVFNGLIQIRKNAFDCEAGQKSKSLLLGAKSTVHAIPKLIIQTDAVKCSHGASISSINPEQLHYLQSRGISRAEAESMIVRGFTEPALEQIPTESLAGRADSALDKKQGGWLQ